MNNIKGFAFTNKSAFSLSGICITISRFHKRCNYNVYRQFEGSEQEFLCEIKGNIEADKLIKYSVNTKLRDVQQLLKVTKEKINSYREKINPATKRPYSEAQLEKIALEIWHKYFLSKEFHLDSYDSYMFLDKGQKFWFYDIVPARKEFVCIDKDDNLPVPGSTLTYSIVDQTSKEVVFSEEFEIPNLITSELSFTDIFQEDIYFYHVELIYKKKAIWGIFIDKSSKKKAKHSQKSTIDKNSFIANFRPNTKNYPDIDINKVQFLFKDKPPNISATEILGAQLNMTRIKTDTGSPNNFKYISFETKAFTPSDFPKTFPLIYPYR